MQLAETLLRFFCGASFLYWGLNGFFNWHPPPPGKPEFQRRIEALAQIGFLFPVVKSIEVIAGALFMLNVWIPFSILILAPLVFGIVSLQLFYNKKEGVLISIWVGAPWLGLLILNLSHFSFLFVPPLW